MLTPRSTRSETVAVMRAAALIFFGSWMWIGLHSRASDAEISRNELMPFQTLFRDLNSSTQRSYRMLEEGVAEAERVRADTKAWPDVVALAGEGIPPFAPDPLDHAGYVWSFVREGQVLNYRGRPSLTTAPELLLVVQEPDSAVIDPALQSGPADETHHLLPDGTLLHVTVWFRRAGAADVRAVVDRPFAEGWTQILAGTAPRKEST